MKLDTKKLLTVIFAVIIVIALVVTAKKGLESVEADEICIIQDPYDGEFHMFTSPGVYWQNFGQVTKYKKEFQYWFTSDEQGNDEDLSIKCRFNDGGHAQISGSLRIKLPLVFDQMIKLHSVFRSQEAIMIQMIRPLIEKSIYMTGPLMSSKQSNAETRNDLLYYIEDQILNGVYKTRSKEVKEADAITGEPKTVTKVEIIADTIHGGFVRNEKSPLTQYGISVYNLSLNEIKYEKAVEEQIASQQKLIMDVQLSIADAKKAEQNAIKIEKQGEAKAATAKWEQEVIKAKAVTEAEQKAKVAEWNMKEAEFYAKSQILKAKADAEYKRAVMVADGGLTQKIEAYKAIMISFNEMLSKYTGNWVPLVVMDGGGNGGYKSGTNSAEQLFNAMAIKTMKDLALDMNIKKQ